MKVQTESHSPADTFISGGIGQTTPAVGEFPAQFSLDILEPPPPEALLRDTSGQKLALGLFVALDPTGAPWRFDLDQPEQPSWLLGGSMSAARRPGTRAWPNPRCGARWVLASTFESHDWPPIDSMLSGHR